MKKFGLCQGAAKTMHKKFVAGWNPYEDPKWMVWKVGVEPT